MQADIAIVGAGCAGLSLAAALADTGPSVGRVVVLDGRTTFDRDRTWCFWNVHEHAFASCVTRQWARWRVVSPGGDVITRASSRYAYQHVPADAFYAVALARIARAAHVELRLGESVDTVDDACGDVRVWTASSELRAAHVFDSRPSGDGVPCHGVVHRTRLVQAFAGRVVCTAVPTFDADTVTLMDFTVDQPDDGFAFGYVLPYSPNEALVELAVIAEQAAAPAQLDAAVARYIARLTGSLHTIRAREHGVIPMDASPIIRRSSPHVTRIGVSGGMAKPSTGYAFLAIQRDVEALVADTGRAMATCPPPPRGSVARWLDHVFLRRLRADPAGAPALFTRLFAAAEPDALVRFLSDVPSPRDVASVVAALPAAPFVAEVCRMAIA